MRIAAIAQTRQRPWYLFWRAPTTVQLLLPATRTATSTTTVTTTTTYSNDNQNIRVNVVDRLQSIFLPRDFRTSVSQNYLSFIKWQVLSSTCGTIMGVLSTQSLLTALGMGATGALPAAATLNWILKDGLGLVGGVVYTSLRSHLFDSEPKRYRFRASLALQVATFCELLTPLFPHLFLPMASLSNVAKNMAWLALSGTRAQMNLSFCLKDNLGDVTAKSGSQSTAASLIGTGIGVMLAANCEPSSAVPMLTCLPMATLGLYSVYRSNCVVVSSSFDLQRLELVMHRYLNDGKGILVTRLHGTHNI